MITVKFDAPDTILDIDKLIEGSVVAVEETTNDTLRDFETTAAPFDDPVPFTTSVKVTSSSVTGSTSTDDDNYVRLNRGFDVPPVVNKPMYLYPGYAPKTFPGVIRSRRGGNLGDRIVRTKRRGFTVQARNFDLAIANKNRPKFFRRIARVVKEAAR